MTFTRAFVFTLLVLLMLTAAFMAGYVFHMVRTGQDHNFSVLEEAYDILTQNGVKDVPPAPAIEYGMIRGMVEAYDDPYTQFVEPPQHELQSNALQGSFGGIGVGLGNDQEGYVVLFPFPAGPASAAGIQEGDRLLFVGSLEIQLDTPVESIQSAIRGPVGDRVTLTLARPPDYTPFRVTVKRAEIALPSVTSHLAPGEPRLGVLEINLIAASTSDEIQRAIRELQGRGATHFVLDLRDNPGGLLNAGVDIARLFLKDGVVIEQQYKGREVETFHVDRSGPLTDVPLAVLINGGSASAAEIIAGALKAHQRAILVGTASFGKDSIQLVFDLQDRSSLHITAARWWVPGLEPPLGGTGVQPDVVVEPSEDQSGPDPLLQAAARQLFRQP